MRVGAAAAAFVLAAAGACASGPALPPRLLAPAADTDPVGGLVIAAETAADSYDRASFAGWLDADGDGCDTHAEVLQRESTVAATTDLGCTVSVGSWVSYLDGYATTNAGELEIDHTVALAEAWSSGAAAWTPDAAVTFANDLDLPAALHAVTAAENARKGDRDPADYQPAAAGARCAFARDWIAVKAKWALTVDAAEAAALRNVLAACPAA